MIKSIIDGWKDIWGNFLCWKFNMNFPYNDYDTWCFFNILSNEHNPGPFKIYLSARDFDNLMERLDEPPDPKAMEKIRKVLERRAPWDDYE